MENVPLNNFIKKYEKYKIFQIDGSKYGIPIKEPSLDNLKAMGFKKNEISTYYEEYCYEKRITTYIYFDISMSDFIRNDGKLILPKDTFIITDYTTGKYNKLSMELDKMIKTLKDNHLIDDGQMTIDDFLIGN